MPFTGSSGAPSYGGVAAAPPGNTGTIREPVPFEMVTHSTIPAVAVELVLVPALDVVTETFVASEHSTDAVISSATVLLVFIPPLRSLTQTALLPPLPLPALKLAGHATAALPPVSVHAALPTAAVQMTDVVEPSATILFAAVAPAVPGWLTIPAATSAAAATTAAARRIIRVPRIYNPSSRYRMVCARSPPRVSPFATSACPYRISGRRENRSSMG